MCVWLGFVIYHILSFLVCNHLNEEDRAGCFPLFVFLLSCDC